MTQHVYIVMCVLIILQASAFVPFGASQRGAKELALHAQEAHRNIIVLSHNVSQDVADGIFDVNCLLSGRVDVLLRCVNSALWVSNGIRKDTTIFLMLFPHNITIEIKGSLVSGLNPDERTMALCLQRTLLAGDKSDTMKLTTGDSRRNVELLRLQEKQHGRPSRINPNKPGSLPNSEKRTLRAARKQREAMIRRINRSNGDTLPLGFTLYSDDSLNARLEHVIGEYEGCPILMLNELGDPLSEVLQETISGRAKKKPVTTTVILGDQMGYEASDEKMLTEHDAVREVSLGPLSLLTSQCITITHHYLDKC